MRQVKGVGKEDAEWLVAARGNGYHDPVSIWHRAGVGAPVLEKLAQADAFADVGEHLTHECSRGIGEEDEDKLWKTRHTRCYTLLGRFLKMMPTDKEFKQLPDVVALKAMDMACKIRTAIGSYAE